MHKYAIMLFLGAFLALNGTGQNVTFQVDMSNQSVGGQVYLTGDFANWHETKLQMSDPDNDDIYTLTILLRPGIYAYKFLNGGWAGEEPLSSPATAYCAKSDNGGYNRVLQIHEGDTVLPPVCFDACLPCGQSSTPADVSVTFRVDMSALGPGTTYLTGNTLDNWCGNCIQMTDANNDQIYEVIRAMAPGFHEFKFTRNGWSNGENFSWNMPCTFDNFGFINRALYVPIGGAPMTLQAHPFNGCAPHAVNIHLEVDMSHQTVDPGGVFVAGNFNGWSAASTPLEDLGNGIWGRNIIAAYGDTLHYQFYNGGTPESVPAACEDGGGKRMLVVPWDMPRLPAVCFSACAPCTDALNLVWSDEFNGSSLNTNKWNYAVGNGTNGWGNNELQFYTASSNNARTNNGHLEITARRENLGGYAYTSARLHTEAKGDFTHGRVEARIRLPEGQGIWPAFWLFPTDEVYGGWPRSGEIDIMELVGHDPDRVHGTVHYGPDPGPGHYYDGNHYDLPGNVNFSDGFHVFAIEWEPNEIRWYMDSILYHSISPWEIAPCDWPYNQDFFIILNVAVGGNWPGPPNGSTQFPQTMYVDYVRVYGDGPVAVAPPATAEMAVYPNPLSETTTVRFSGGNTSGRWQLSDITGRTVAGGTFLQTSSFRIQRKGLGNGMYLLRVVEDSGRTMVKKLILE